MQERLYKIKHLIKEKTIMANKFQEKQILAEVLSELYSTVEDKEKRVHYDYKIVGKKDVQSTSWRTGELLWEDDEKTIPKMEDDWQNVPRADEDLTEEDRLKIKVYKYVMTQLEKML
jgi:hypothetical protein